MDDKDQPICCSISSSQFEDVFLNLLRGLELPNLVIVDIWSKVLLIVLMKYKENLVFKILRNHWFVYQMFVFVLASGLIWMLFLKKKKKTKTSCVAIWSDLLINKLYSAVQFVRNFNF